MAGTRKAPLWRQAFLRALRRLGNVRAAAFEAGVDPGTAYDHRAKDAGFRTKWDGALKAFKRKPSPQPSPRGGRGSQGSEELVLRRTRSGDKLVRAAPGRWSGRVEESFLDGLAATGCVTSAAAAAGISTNALYRRREHYPEFAARWDERVERFREQLPGLINAAAVESMSPEVPGAKRRGRARLPKLNPGEAIRVYAINENARAKAAGPKRRGGVSSREQEEKSHEELVQSLAQLCDMLEQRVAGERRAAGWTDLGDGVWAPPGWIVVPPPKGLLPPPDPPSP